MAEGDVDDDVLIDSGDDAPPRGTGDRVKGAASSNGTAAVISQGIQAATSLALQIIALRQLGAAGLGEFAILTAGVLVTFTAIHTGWIGDALPVFDRHKITMKRALSISQVVSAVAAVVVAYLAATLLADRSFWSAALFALTLLAWTVEETGRRIFMARLEFWGLVRNDVVYLIGAATTTVVVWVLDAVSIDTLLLAMLVGASASIIDGRRRLPSEEFELPLRGPNDMAALARFSTWRAGQIGVRPLSMLMVRVVIVNATSAAGLGLLETGRLVLAPIFTAANGIGSYLLPTFVKTVHDDRATMRLVARVAISGMTVTALYGAFAAVVVPALQTATDSDTVLPRAMVIAWTIYAMAYFANIPFANALVARHRSRDVFGARCIDGIIGVALAYGFVSTVGLSAVPIGLALGVIGGSGWLWWWLSRTGVMVGPATATPGVVQDPTRSTTTTVPFRHQWVAVIPLLFIVTTEFKWRQRDLASSLSGSADIAILVEVGVYAAVAAYLLAFIAAPPGRARPTAPMFMMRAYAISLAVTALWAPYPQLAIVRAAQLVVMVGYALAVTTRATRREMHQLAHGYIALIAASSVLGIFWRVPFSRLQLDRFTWMNVHPVIAGAMLAIAVVLCVAYLVRDVGRTETMLWPRGAYVLALAICAVALVATKTRGSIAGAAVGVVVILTLSLRRRERLPSLVLAFMGAGALAFAIGPPILAYLSRGETTAELTSLSNRTTLWSVALDLFSERPFNGWGMTASRGLFFEEVGLGGAHNSLINVLVDGGLIVTVFWLGLIVSVLAALHRVWRQYAEVDAVLVFGVMAALIVNGLTTEGMGTGNGVSALWLLICAAWVGVLQRRGRRLAERRLTISAIPDTPTSDETAPVAALAAAAPTSRGVIGAGSAPRRALPPVSRPALPPGRTDPGAEL